jgi:ankyrin repeat protein
MHASSQGKPRVVQLLLQQNAATINLQDISGWTALMWAVAVNAVDTVRVLLAVRSVSLSVLNEMKESVFHLAARRGNLAVSCQCGLCFC